MTGWIFNASPVILLGKIGHIDLIEAVSPKFRIPEAVIDEVGAGSADDPAVRWLRQTSIRDHIVETPAPPSVLIQWDLGLGETAVLSLGLDQIGSVVVLDDLAARQFAHSFDIPVIGTLGLLIRAKRLGLLPEVKPLLESLLEHGANLSNAVVRRALELANELS